MGDLSSYIPYFFAKGVFVLDISTYADEFMKNDKSKPWYPIWYYKKLKPVSMHTVLFELLSSKFVVEIDSAKYGLEFFNSEEHGMQMRFQYDDLTYNSRLTSHALLEKAFREGTWYQVLKENTSNEFRNEYKSKKYEKSRNELISFLGKMLGNATETKLENP